MIIKSWLGDHKAALAIFNSIEKPISLSEDDNFKAWFNTKASSLFWFVGDLDKALSYNDEAIRLSKKVRNHSQTAVALNNSAGIYRARKEFRKAHELARNSCKIFQTIGGKSGLAHIIDTEAQIFFDEGNYSKALETIDVAIDLFTETGIYAGRADSILVKIRILLKRDMFEEAMILSYDLKDFVLTSLGKEAYIRFQRPLDEILGPHDIRGKHQVFQINAGPFEGYEKRNHFTFTAMVDKKEQILVVSDCEAIEDREKYVVKCKRSGRFFFGEIYFDSNLELLYLEDRPLKSGGFQVFGKVAAYCSAEEYPDKRLGSAEKTLHTR